MIDIEMINFEDTIVLYINGQQRFKSTKIEEVYAEVEEFIQMYDLKNEDYCITENCDFRNKEKRSRANRKDKIDKGIYVLGISFKEALQDDEIRMYYEKGMYKAGGFVAKYIAVY